MSASFCSKACLCLSSLRYAAFSAPLCGRRQAGTFALPHRPRKEETRRCVGEQTRHVKKKKLSIRNTILNSQANSLSNVETAPNRASPQAVFAIRDSPIGAAGDEGEDATFEANHSRITCSTLYSTRCIIGGLKELKCHEITKDLPIPNTSSCN